ncbi:unnamed protein product [Adineta ricciae]|uniref:Uncharacterized protein n=1 Tax=Adineta ricciae TaxID=249248 RepID=A0A814HI19_ADIRI|nr:unnamed protein product [Adineta ricciae]
MTDLLLLNKISVIATNRSVRRRTDENVDDDMAFPTHVDKRSLRPSSAFKSLLVIIIDRYADDETLLKYLT